jgi:hypothetical protein
LTSPQEALEKILKQYPHLKRESIIFVWTTINKYVQYIADTTPVNEKEPRVPTTKNLVDDIPRFFVYLLGKDADVICRTFQITSYYTFGQILDSFVKVDFFKYGKEDSLDHFNIDSDLIFDIRVRKQLFIQV